MIDAAISLPSPFLSIAQLLSTPAFYEKCATASSKISKYSAVSWTKEYVLKESKSGGLFYSFIKRAASNLASKSGLRNLNTSDFEEVSSLALEQVVNSFPDYRPSSPSSPNKSWGFEAYLYNYAIRNAQKSAHGILFRGHNFSKNTAANFVSLDARDMVNSPSATSTNLQVFESSRPELFSTLPLPQVKVTEEACKSFLLSAVTQKLSGHPSAPAYYHHVVLGKSIRKTSASLNITKSTCHRLLQEGCELVWSAMRDASTASL